MKIKKVIKMNGSIQSFDKNKIKRSIEKTLKQSRIKDGKLATRLTDEVVSSLEKRHKKDTIPVWDIKNTIEWVFVKNKLPDAAKFYILYRFM